MSVALKRPLTVTLVLAALAAPAYAQDVQYSSVTKVDLGGGMNAIMKMAGASEVKETTSIQGKKLRSDTDKSSTIFDLDNGRYIVIDHAAKTYMSVPLADMARVATSSVRGVRAERSNDKLKGTAVDSAGNKADFVVDLKVDPTGERQTVNGYDAKRLLVTAETNVRVTPQGETQSQEAGTLVILMDTWNADTGPAADAVRAWERSASKEMAAAAFGSKANMGPAFASNPGMAEAMKKASEEAKKADGIAVKSTMYLVFVAPDQKFDRALALQEPGSTSKGEKAKRGLRGMVGRKRTRQRAADLTAIRAMAGDRQRSARCLRPGLADIRPDPQEGSGAIHALRGRDADGSALAGGPAPGPFAEDQRQPLRADDDRQSSDAARRRSDRQARRDHARVRFK